MGEAVLEFLPGFGARCRGENGTEDEVLREAAVTSIVGRQGQAFKGGFRPVDRLGPPLTEDCFMGCMSNAVEANDMTVGAAG